MSISLDFNSNNQSPSYQSIHSGYSKYEVDLEECQCKIDSLIQILEDILTKEDYELDFQSVYSKSYEICLNRMGKELYDAVIKLLNKVVKTYYDKLLTLPDTEPKYEFYKYIVKSFIFYKEKIVILCDILSYLERIKERYNFKEDSIHTKALEIFYKNIIFSENLKNKISSAFKREYYQLRQNSFKKNFDLFLDYFTLITNKDYGNFLYTIDILPMLTSETEKFYEEIHTKFSSEIAELQKVKNKKAIYQKIKEHFDFTEKYFLKEEYIFQTLIEKESLLNIVFENLVMKNFDLLFKKGIQKFFKYNETRYFKMAYDLFFNHQIFNTNENINLFQSSFTEIINKSLKKLSETFITIKKNQKIEYFNFLQYIDDLCELKKKYSLFLKDFMNDNVKIEHIIKSLFERQINQNKEFLIAFVKLIHEEIKLSQKVRSNKKLKEFNEKFLIIFKLINDKDLFELEYRKLLGKRLIRNALMIKETEIDFFNIMKKESGNTYVKKIQNMINDIFLSQEGNSDLRNYLNEKGLTNKFDFYLKLLCMEDWPITIEKTFNINPTNNNTNITNTVIQPNSNNNNNNNNNTNLNPTDPKLKTKMNCNIILPPELINCIDNYSLYYYSKFQNRYITIIPDLSWAEIEMNIRKKKYTLIISTFQLIILMLFNKNKKIKISELSEKTNLSLIELKENYFPLVKKKILLLDKNNTYLSINTNYNSNEMKLNLNFKHKEKNENLNKSETKEVSHFILEDRKYQIDAWIIHNLKKYKKLSFNDLKSYLSQCLSNYFVPENNIIKSRLENLMDRNFIERDKDNLETFIYKL